MPKSNIIGYCIIEDLDGNLDVGEWTKDDAENKNIEPSNFFPEEIQAAYAVIYTLNKLRREENA